MVCCCVWDTRLSLMFERDRISKRGGGERGAEEGEGFCKV